MENKYIEIKCDSRKTEIRDKASSKIIKIPWSSIQLRCAGKTYSSMEMEVSENAGYYEARGTSFGMDFLVRFTLAKQAHWCSLEATFTNKVASLPTPEVLVLCETEELKFKAVGYQHQNAYEANETGIATQEGEEVSGGRIPGCGYPVFSDNFFVGIEHVAAYTLKKERGFICRHYPAWNDENIIAAPSLIIGTKGKQATIKSSFLDYIDSISIKKEQSPILCCCTFWSDPYIGNHEYKVSFPHYKRYINQFIEAGIVLDMLMLDAGWNDRKSIFQAKSDIGGDDGLLEISDFLGEHGIRFGLWSSINGDMGVSWKWASEKGYPVGTGIGAAYSSPNKYIVLPDTDFGDKIAERYVELITKTKCEFFKIDWDCETASNDDYMEKYPTQNHIRVASIDVINQIHSEVIKNDPKCLIRNGWWPSPWWLKDVTFTWLAHSGDCEYAALPSINQRDQETTHRDAMYYYIFKESETPFPLDSIDNHEMIKAYRNPFAETFESWCNSVVMLYTRGTIYQSVMINAATMPDEYIAFFSEMRSFAEKYKQILFNKSARFIGGNPAMGQRYGFLHQTSNEAIAVIRNPSVTPCLYSVSEMILDIDFDVNQVLVVYPYCENIKLNETISLLSHQVVLLYATKRKESLPLEISSAPFIVSPKGETYLSAGLEPNDSFGTIQADFVMIRDISIDNLGSEHVDNTITHYLKIKIPDRMQDTLVIFEMTGNSEYELDKIPLRVFHDRYPKTGQGHALAVTRLYSKKKEGYGTDRNKPKEKINSIVQYRLCSIPSGGEFFLNVELNDLKNIENFKLKAHVTGRRGKSRKSKKLSLPEIFTFIPKIHNSGIGESCSLIL